MNEEYRKEEPRDAGLATAALAAAVEPTVFKKDFDLEAREKEPKRMEVQVGDASIMKDNRVADAGAAAALATDVQGAPLFSSEEAKEFRARWDSIQGGFVDEPRQSVAQADSLVAGVMKRLAEMFADERQNLTANGIEATVSRPRIFVLHCAAIGRFSAAFFRFSVVRQPVAVLSLGRISEWILVTIQQNNFHRGWLF